MKGKARHGHGSFTYPNGDYQQGIWLDDVFWEGKCKVHCIDGEDDVYEGNILEGVRHGKGKLTKKDGTVQEGIWNSGQIISVIQRYANGDTYIGDVKDGQPDGKGKFTFADGNYYDGDWVAGKRQGIGKFFTTSGVNFEGYWQDDRFISPLK